MGNNRKAIRNAIKELMIAAPELSYLSEIFTSRRANVSQLQHLPCVTIFTPNETASKRSVNCKDYIRQLDVNLEVRVDASNNVDDVLDDIMKDIENVITSNLDFKGTVLSTELVESVTEVGHDGNKPIALGILTYRSTYIA